MVCNKVVLSYIITIVFKVYCEVYILKLDIIFDINKAMIKIVEVVVKKYKIRKANFNIFFKQFNFYPTDKNLKKTWSNF